MKILLTGANGFIGQAIYDALALDGHKVIRAARSSMSNLDFCIGHIDGNTNWVPILSSGIDIAIHLAGKTTISGSHLGDSAKSFFSVNFEGTLNFAQHCANYGVKRFIFLSTTKILEVCCDNASHTCSPITTDDAYGLSKLKAEESLWQISQESSMQVVILRPPLVYGPGVKGNFLKLIRAVDHQYPFPFGSINNRRSYIFLENLVDAVRVCLTHPKAAGQAWMVSDNDDISTPELIRRLASALYRSALIIPIPIGVIKLFGNLISKKSDLDRLIGSLCVDTNPIQNVLGWSPPFTMQMGLEKTAIWYRKHIKGIS